MEALKNSLAFFNNKDLYFFIFLYLIYIGYMDLMYRRIPNFATYSMIILRFIFGFSGLIPIRLDSLIGGLIFFLGFFTIAYYKNVKMGGDIKAVFALGLYFGTGGSLALNGIAVLLGGLYFLLRVIKKEKISQEVNAPYGLFLAISYGLMGVWYFV